MTWHSDVEDLSAAVQSGNKDLALARLATFDLGRAPELPVSVTVELARWLDEAGHGQVSAELIAARMRASRTPEERAELELALGSALLRAGRPEEAWAHLITTLELAPESALAERAKMLMRFIDPSRFV